MSAVTIDTISPWRHVLSSVNSPTSTAIDPPTAHQVMWRGVGDSGKRPSRKAPRDGMRSPLIAMITTMMMSGSAACQSRSGIQLSSPRRLRISLCSMPMPSPASVVSVNERNPPSSAAASAGRDQQAGRAGIEPGDRGDEDHRGAGQHRRDHPVDGGQPIGGVPEQHRSLLALGRGPGGQPEAGVVEHAGQHRGGHEHEPEKPQPIGRDLHAEQVDDLGRQDRLRLGQRAALAAEPLVRDAEQVEEQAQAGHDLGQRRRLAQRSEHQPVDDEADERAHHHRHGERGGPRRLHVAREDLHPARQPDDRDQQLTPLAQRDVGVGQVHAERGVGEVHDPGRAVGEQHAQGQRGDDRAGAQPEQQVLELGHALGPITRWVRSRSRPGHVVQPARRAGTSIQSVSCWSPPSSCTTRICCGAHSAGRSGTCFPSHV